MKTKEYLPIIILSICLSFSCSKENSNHITQFKECNLGLTSYPKNPPTIEDSLFKPCNGSAVIGTPLNTVLDISPNKLLKDSGWGYYIRLDSGWNAGFSVGKSGTAEITSPDEVTVEWLFKRK